MYYRALVLFATLLRRRQGPPRRNLAAASKVLSVLLGLSLLIALPTVHGETIHSNLAWLRYLGGSGVDEVGSMALDGQGDLWIAGTTWDPSTWQTGSITPIRMGPGGIGDAFVARLNSSGDLTLLVFLGGQGADSASSLACTPGGGVVVVGTTGSADFPVTSGAVQRQLRGAANAFVVKLGAAGDLQWATFLGGSAWDKGLAVAAMTGGSVVVGGSTSSPDFPAVNPLQAPGPAMQDDGFLAVLTADAASVAFATHLGGPSGLDEVRDVAVDAADNIIAVGRTGSADFPVLRAYQSSIAGGFLTCGGDAFVTKLSWPPAQIVFSTYLGGNGPDTAESVAADGNGYVTLAAGTVSTNFPAVLGSYAGPPALDNMFVTRMPADGSNLVFSSRLPVPGSPTPDCVLPPQGFRVRLDRSGQSWAVGRTSFSNFPVVNPVQADLRGPTDGFLSVLSNDGSQLVFSTFLGGAGPDALRDVAISAGGDVFVAGYTESSDLPASQGSYRGGRDVFVARISTTARALTATATAAPLAGLAPLNVSFSGGASGGTGIYTFDWDFGDGSPHSAEQDPSHTYVAGGTYVATVKVTDSVGGTASASVAISVTHNCWVACSASVPLATRAGNATGFTGSAIPADCSGTVSYSWEFGDGQTSTQQNPSHSYASAGLYAWSLTAAIGAASCTRSGTIVVTAAPANFSYLIPALAHKPGYYGSQWRADVAVLNPNDAAANLTLVYFSGSAPVLRNAVLAGHTSVEWSDILVALFGFPQDASTSGVVQVISDESVASIGRSYNLSAGGTFGGTFPALTTADGLSSAKVGLLPQLKRNASYRSNVGFANLGTFTCTVRLRLFDHGGVKLGEKTMDVAAGRWTQLDDVFGKLGAGDADLAYGTVEVLTNGGTVWAYAAVIDNATGDPTVVPVIVP
jgi:PKD repeat protein